MGPRVLLIDDSQRFRDAARLLLESEGMEVVGVASSTADALRQAASIQPDIILVDVFLGSESGLELARQLVERDEGQGTIVIVISSHEREEFADLLGRSAAAGFLSKSELSASAIRRIVEQDRQPGS